LSLIKSSSVFYDKNHDRRLLSEVMIFNSYNIVIQKCFIETIVDVSIHRGDTADWSGQANPTWTVSEKSYSWSVDDVYHIS
jgi:hypothetical protein